MFEIKNKCQTEFRLVLWLPKTKIFEELVFKIKNMKLREISETPENSSVFKIFSKQKRSKRCGTTSEV